MSDVVLRGGDAAVEPISLYIGLNAGAKADLEVIARTALVFAGAIREVAYIVDPSMDVRIEIVSGTESSLSLNTWIKAKVKDKIAAVGLAAIAFGAGTWITNKTVEFAYQQVLSAIFEGKKDAGLDEKTVQEIVKKTVDAYSKQVRSKSEQIFSEVQLDPAISSLGITTQPGARPVLIVPRSEFHELSLSAAESALIPETEQRRIRRSIETVTLISPVLAPGKRRWKFRGRAGEFGAVIKDGLFLENVLRGISTIPLVAGIRMEVELQTIEDFIRPAWVVKDRSILQVRRITPPSTQLLLESSHGPDEPPNSKDENEDC